jgi:hypothetical protein
MSASKTVKQLILLWMLASYLFVVASAQETTEVRISEYSLRQTENTHIQPLVPRTDAYGISVLEVYVREDGRIKNIVTLQTSSPEAERAIRHAMSHWKFDREYMDGKPVALTGLITYYNIRLNNIDTIVDPFSRTFVCSPDFTSCH